MQSLYCGLKTWSICLAIVIISMLLCTESVKLPNVPAIFAFGDSIFDPGNNNDMFTFSRSNFPPYGISFEDHKATGRFCNGRIPPDFIVEELGIKKYLPAYLDPNLGDTDLITGVSFASAGTGFDPLTPAIVYARSMNEQLKMFSEYVGKITGIVGIEEATFILNSSISFIECGCNDLTQTYFSTPFRRNDYDFDEYSDLMLSFATFFIKQLYKRGVQKIGMLNLPPIGNLPSRRSLAGGPSRDIAKENNELAQLFNSKLKAELHYLGSQLPNAKLVYIDIYNIFLDVLVNHSNYGFEVADVGCCGSGLIEVGVLCNSFSLLCDVNKYVFWDSFHPTERGYQIIMHQLVDKYMPLFF